MLIPGVIGAGVTVWQLTHRDSQSAVSGPVPTLTVPTATGVSPATDSSGTDPPPDAITTQSCTSNADGYTVQYPPGWVTESATSARACHFFAAEPFSVTAEDTTAGDVAIDASVPGSYDDFIEALSEPQDAAITLQHTPLTINDRRAEQLILTVQEDGRDVYGYGYVIDDGGKPLVIVSMSQSSRSSALEQVVTDMAYSLVLL